MDKFIDFMERKLMPIASKLGSNKYLQAVSGGFMATMGATIVGSIFILLANLPIKAYTDWLAATGLNRILALPSQVTIDLISIYAVFFIAYNLASQFNSNPTGAGLTSLVSFFLITGRDENGLISPGFLGARGLFTAIFVALVSARIFVAVVKKGWVIKLPDSVPPNVANSFSALIPAFFVVAFFLAIAAIMSFTPFGTLHAFVFTTIQQSLMNFLGDNIFSFLFFEFMLNFLWFFGLHGGNITGSLTNPLWTPLSLENFAASQAGQPLPYIITSAFKRSFVSGGVGSMFALAIIMVLFARSKQYKTLGKLTVPTTLFFINEPLLFGIPVVLNPLLFIPLVFITPILGVITFTVMRMGIIPAPNGTPIPWTTPPVMYGILQGSWKIAAWELLMILSAGLMWFPFFKIIDNKAYLEEMVEENKNLES